MGLTAWLMDYLDWRDIFRIYSLVDIVWAMAFYAYFRTRPVDHPWVNDAELELNLSVQRWKFPATPNTSGLRDNLQSLMGLPIIDR